MNDLLLPISTSLYYPLLIGVRRLSGFVTRHASFINFLSH
jgi:hypothetical protein